MKIAGMAFLAIGGVAFLLGNSGRSTAGLDAAACNAGAAVSAAVGALLIALAKRRQP